MNKEKLIANWDELKDETKAQILALADKEILAVADKGVEKDYYTPQLFGLYYTFHFDTSGVYCTLRSSCACNFDEMFIEIGNCFKTEEEAMFAGSCDYYTKRYETYVNRHTKKLDWGNNTQKKYFIFYNCLRKLIDFDCRYFLKSQGVPYASSEQILKDAIADVGEENFLKYVMKIKTDKES